MSKSIFISRELKSDSAFFNFEKAGYKLHHESLIDIKPLSFEIPKSDWIFFYSKNGINEFFKTAKYDISIKYGVLGNSTSEYFKSKTGKTPDYTGQNNAEEIAEYYIHNASEKTVTFVKAQNSISSVEKAMHIHEVNIDVRGLIVYDNIIKKVITSPRCDIVCLTSPLNSKAWFEKYPHQEEMIYAIGQTTANYIESTIGLTVPYCKMPSEKSLFELVSRQYS